MRLVAAQLEISHRSVAGGEVQRRRRWMREGSELQEAISMGNRSMGCASSPGGRGAGQCGRRRSEGDGIDGGHPWPERRKMARLARSRRFRLDSFSGEEPWDEAELPGLSGSLGVAGIGGHSGDGVRVRAGARA
jgi:hypothetical protein